MKILLTSDTWTPAVNGVVTSATTLRAALQARGHEVRVLTLAGGHRTRIAGGVIIFKIGYDMLQARYTHVKLNDNEIKTYVNDISITPLGIPMLCGPGAIANTIVLMSDAHTLSMKAVLVGSIAFIYILTYYILRASTRLVKVLGETGNNVMMRLMGLLLMVIAVECFVGGIKPILIDVLREGIGK